MAQLPPGSTGLPFVGEALPFLKDPFAFTIDRTKRHGHVWKTKILSDKVIFFAGAEAFAFFIDPENFTRVAGSPKHIQELLHPESVAFLDGDRHRTRKRLLLEAFTDASLDSYLPGIFAIITRVFDGFADGTERAIGSAMPQLGFDIADLLFAAADPKSSNESGSRDFSIMNRGSFSPPINLPFTAYGKAIKARDRLRAYVREAVATKDGEGSALGVLKKARGTGGEQLTSDELSIELLHFYFAAHGPMTSSLAWLLVVLGEHPELAAKLRAEADVALGDGAPTVAQGKALPLARAVSRETLRSYPIVPTTFFGVAKRDLEYGGFAIPSGWKAAGAIWPTLRDDATFRDPTKFDGARLDDAALGKLHAHAFVPQGGGPPDGHRCAGERLIQLLMPAFAAWFTRRYDLAWPAQDTSQGPGGIGPLPKDGLRVKITKRAN